MVGDDDVLARLYREKGELAVFIGVRRRNRQLIEDALHVGRHPDDRLEPAFGHDERSFRVEALHGREVERGPGDVRGAHEGTDGRFAVHVDDASGDLAEIGELDVAEIDDLGGVPASCRPAARAGSRRPRRRSAGRTTAARHR